MHIATSYITFGCESRFQLELKKYRKMVQDPFVTNQTLFNANKNFMANSATMKSGLYPVSNKKIIMCISYSRNKIKIKELHNYNISQYQIMRCPMHLF